MASGEFLCFLLHLKLLWYNKLKWIICFIAQNSFFFVVECSHNFPIPKCPESNVGSFRKTRFYYSSAIVNCSLHNCHPTTTRKKKHRKEEQQTILGLWACVVVCVCVLVILMWHMVFIQSDFCCCVKGHSGGVKSVSQRFGMYLSFFSSFPVCLDSEIWANSDYPG